MVEEFDSVVTEEFNTAEYKPPKIRGDCKNIPRPCKRYNCKYNLFRDNPTGPESCTLDVADRGDHTTQEVAHIMGYESRQRCDQIVHGAFAQLREKHSHLLKSMMGDYANMEPEEFDHYSDGGNDEA